MSTCPSPTPISLSDVKMKIRGSLRHVPNLVANPKFPQNASMCVFLQGDFRSGFGLLPKPVFGGDRAL